MLKNERQIGAIKGHRVVIERDLSDGKAISYKIAEYLTVDAFEKLQLEVAQKQKELSLEALQERNVFEEEMRIEADKKAQRAKDEAYKTKYSLTNFIIAHNTIQHWILLGNGMEEDDADIYKDFPRLLDDVLDGKISIEDAVKSYDILNDLFNKMTGGVE